VADLAFVQGLQKRGLRVRIINKAGRIRCANGSYMRIIGYTYFPLTIGSTSHHVKFTVVESLFPKLIIGLRTMKTEGIILDAPNDSIQVDGERVGFVSKTEPCLKL
jgi:hypothetical protein